MFSANSPCKRDRLDDPEEESEPPVKKQTDFDDEDFGDNDDDLDLIQGKASDQPTISQDEPSAPAGDGEYPPSKVLLFTVQNHNNFPVDVSVLHNICTAKGATVNRIVMIRKNGVQAMVEFDTVETAAAIKGSLNGEFIYSGCCNLKIDWGKPQSLNVIKNNDDSWDYTLPDSNKDTAKKSQPLLPLPQGYALRSGPKPFPPEGYPGQAPGCDPYARLTPANPMTCGPRPQGNMHGALNSGPGILSNQHMLCRGPTPGAQSQKLSPTSASGSDDGNSMLQQGSVLMVYGMNKDQMNCKRVFNLFCLYGNVVRVKFLKSKDGVAMVQMGDNASCERVIKNLNGCFVCGHKMLMGYSKQAFIQDVPNPVVLPDGSISFEDFMGNRNNRFTTPETATKNRIQPPSKVLYFFNAPPGATQMDFQQVFSDCHVKQPKNFKVFPSKTQRSSTGLIEWDTKAECVDALVAANHFEMPNPTAGNTPYILKFCFSDAPIKG